VGGDPPFEIEKVKLLDVLIHAPDLGRQAYLEVVAKHGARGDEPANPVASQDQGLDRFDGSGGRRPRRAVDKRQLAEVVAGPYKGPPRTLIRALSRPGTLPESAGPFVRVRYAVPAQRL